MSVDAEDTAIATVGTTSPTHTSPEGRLPQAKLAAGMMSWAADVSDAQFRTIGLLELLGAAGLILPGLLDIAPVLTPLAATGLALTMVGACVTHARLGETDRLVAPVVLFAIAVFVAIERFGPHSL